jgi:hypothetical protein
MIPFVSLVSLKKIVYCLFIRHLYLYFKIVVSISTIFGMIIEDLPWMFQEIEDPFQNFEFRKKRTFIFFFKLCGGTFGTAAITGLLYQPQMIGEVILEKLVE